MPAELTPLERDLQPTWMSDQTWTPFLDDGELPVRYRKMPWLAANYSFERTLAIMRIPRRKNHTLQTAYDYWSWFRSPIEAQERAASKPGGET